MGVFEEIEYQNVLTARRGFFRAQILAGSDHHNGMMIAIYPPEEVIKRITYPGGEAPSEMHITLAYMGDITDYDSTPEAALEELEQALREIQTTSIPITVNGAHTFPPKDGQYPLVAGVEVSPALQNLRDQVVDLCNTTQFKVDMTFPEYKPHITLKYFEESEPEPNISVPKMTFEANMIAIVVAGQRRFLDTDDLW